MTDNQLQQLMNANRELKYVLEQILTEMRMNRDQRSNKAIK